MKMKTGNRRKDLRPRAGTSLRIATVPQIIPMTALLHLRCVVETIPAAGDVGLQSTNTATVSTRPLLGQEVGDAPAAEIAILKVCKQQRLRLQWEVS